MEFLSIMSKGSTQEKILWSFDFFDIDRNGYIERQEMIKVWNILHPTYFPYLSYYRGPRGCIRDGGTWEQRLTIRSLHSGYTGCPKSRISVLRLFIIDFISLFLVSVYIKVKCMKPQSICSTKLKKTTYAVKITTPIRY